MTILGLMLAVSATVGFLPRLFLPQSFVRVCVTTLAANATLGLSGWFFALTVEERIVLRKLICGKITLR